MTGAARAGALFGRLIRRPAAALSLGYLALISAAAAGAGALGLDPLDQDLSQMLEGPSADHWFGADELGRDILARVVYGAPGHLATLRLKTCLRLLGRLKSVTSRSPISSLSAEETERLRFALLAAEISDQEFAAA